MKPSPNPQSAGADRLRLQELHSALLLPGIRLWILSAMALMCLCLLGSASSQAQMVTVNPPETTGALSNPLMGFRPDLNSWDDNPAYPTVVRHYIRWNEIENAESDSVQKIRDFCNSKWANLPAANIKVIPRVFIDWDSNVGNEYWPADLQSGDWSSQQFKDRVVRLIGRLGEVWDKDPRVAWVQTGIIGYWGEQENPVGVDEDGWGQRLSDAFTNAFQKKRLIVRNMSHWPSDRYGVYWDSYGHPSQQSVWNSIRSYNNQGRHLKEVVEGEVAYNWGETTFDPLYGGEPNNTLDNVQYTDNMIDAIRDLHCTALGWIASYSFDGAHGTNPDNVRANAARMQREFGYRYHITGFSSSARTDPGGKLDVSFKVRNNGSAPFYEDWPVAVVLINESTRQIAWKATLPNVDVRTWHPGSNYSTTTRSYQTPAREHEISARLPLPSTLATGQYLVGLTILEPLSRTPGVFFAVPNFFKQSQSQPLCRIGVGVNAPTHTLDGVLFNDLVTDEARSYPMTQQGGSYSLTLQSSSQGTISKSSTNSSFLKDTGVEVKATGVLGYAFNSWGGALAGTIDNPAIVVMDANKSVSANYVPVPTHTLATSATHGSITLDPPGGIYNAGTVVTVTASPDRGYVFGSWSGDLNGSLSPTTLIMNGNQTVSANFAVFNGDVAPWIETFTLPDGTMTDGAPTSWTATRSSGLFQVGGNRLMINQGSAEGIFETADISISGGSVRVSLDVQPGGGLDSGDYVRLYKIVDGGAPVQIGEQIIGNFTGTKTLAGSNIAGSKLKLRIATKVTAPDEFYYFDNLKVEDEAQQPSYTLTTHAINGSITQDRPDGVYSAGTVVNVSAVPGNGYEFGNWGGDLSGTMNPTTITMTGNKSITANFTAMPSGPTGFLVNCGGPAYTAGDGSVFSADGNHSGGGTYSTTSQTDGTTDDPLYQTERFGSSFGYTVPLADGNYEVSLMFAEIYHNAANKRVFNVAIEGSQAISNLDIWSKVGKNKAYSETRIITVSDGFLDLAFSSVVDNAKISAIKVTRLSPSVSYTLQTSATHGTIELDPSGGIYSPGQVVNVLAKPDSGYAFGSWNGDLSGSSSPTTLTMNGNKTVTANFSLIPDPWREWQVEHFTEAERNDPHLSGESADFDSDGLVNLMEYAMGLLPKDPTTAGFPSMIMTPGAMTLRYRKNVAAGDVILDAQVSDNLIDWTTNGVTRTVIEAIGGIQTIEATSTIPPDAESFFIRVRGTK